ncbi:hypothetical protein AB0D67_20020 [Streptosporangium sp. NPDC048047]|uniref:hypothetical protein n=1 Tax=Streptosporangium sp. NPDC048047 TaxID=3155748 RepID=UPI00343F4815
MKTSDDAARWPAAREGGPPGMLPVSLEPDFRALDRRERAIIGRMLAGLTLGMALALAGRMLTEVLPTYVVAFYDPYLYGVLILAMTRGIARPGWALLTGGLTGAGIAAGQMTAYALDRQTPLIPGDPDPGGIGWEMAALAVVLAAFGLTGHLCRRPGLCGDLVVGALSGVLLARFAQELRSAELLDRVNSFSALPWSLAALVIMGLALPVILRPATAARARTAVVTLACAVLCTVGFAFVPALALPV